MRDSTGSGIEWCELSQGRVCWCEQIYDVTETKCPDLGDWSEVPHDELDTSMSQLQFYNYVNRLIAERHVIALDRDRLLSYIED